MRFASIKRNCRIVEGQRGVRFSVQAHLSGVGEGDDDDPVDRTLPFPLPCYTTLSYIDAAVAESKILTGARQALAFARGELTDGFVVHVPEEFDVKALRRKLGMSQARFAASFGFGLDAVQSWEQGRRRPEGAARVLLKVIEHDPDAVRRALAA